MCRLHGDKFQIKHSTHTTDNGVQAFIKRLREEIRSAITIGDRMIYVGISIGTASCTKEGDSLQEVLDAAEIFMRENKRSHHS